MTNKQTFTDAAAKHLKTLELYVPVVAKVHGKQHPEFFDVRQLFDEMKDNLKEPAEKAAELSETFKKLRKITDNYRVPEDVCESYEAVYEMLSELDQAFEA